ncbi:hypothetical protein [Pedobacter steynii]|uniref:Ferredoxin subunit of nitrite reductase or a ring-hydroxylating dioxygenase n=1 Tax=Pedobacter steynii TaxID=430522 RepID=A0A1D7QEV8_9SPHI|nr:hypothetical protein [Pedobacter steynii]AOM77144.1 hypothetical protein BFS30_08165 [Pedobacter steynii]
MIKRITGALVLLLLFAGCGKDDGSYIPNVLVNYHITAAAFSDKAVNGVLMVDDIGVAGIMVIKITPTNYVAFDRCSSVNPEQRCKVTVDNGGITATDPCSGAKFLLTDGSPQRAPAVRYLKSYRVSVSGLGSNDIIVSN